MDTDQGSWCFKIDMHLLTLTRKCVEEAIRNDILYEIVCNFTFNDFIFKSMHIRFLALQLKIIKFIYFYF